jgi:hypothetical protein
MTMANDTTTTTNGQQPAPAAMVKAPPPPPDHGGAIDVFASVSNFEAAQRMARALSSGSMVPEQFRGQEGVSNCLIALDIASRVKASVLMVMQNLDIIHGRPAWRAQFLIGSVNSCGRFTPLRYRFVGTRGAKDWGCIATAKDRRTGEELEGTLITVQMAHDEGWATKSGSKWKTMPEQMLRYRAAAFWTRTYAPEIALGLPTVDEVIDVHGEVVAEEVRPLPKDLEPGDAAALEAELLGKDLPTPPTSAPEVDAEPVQ